MTIVRAASCFLLALAVSWICVFTSSAQTAETGASTPGPSPTHDRVPLPREGLVPDRETAIKVAEVILIRLYGESITAQKPYRVKEEDYVWWISGTLQEDEFGTPFTIAISRHTAAVLHVGF